MKRFSLSIVIASVLASCTIAPRAQVLVTVDAEPGVRAISHNVRVRMWGRSPNDGFDDALYLEEAGPRYPWTVALRPQSDDPARIFRFEATAYTGGDPSSGNFVAQARIISGYEPGQILHVYLLLQDACIGVPCEQLSESCRDGRCEEIPMEVPYFDPDAGFPDGGAPPGECTVGAPELCNHLDDNCDRRVDEGFDFLSDPANCGGCGNDCDRPHASATCVQAACRVTCDAQYDDCNGRAVDGCEQSLIDPAHCGACDVTCSGSTPLCEDPDGATGPQVPRCVSTCSSTSMLCGGSCVDTTSDEAHCGSCETACTTAPHVTATCTSSTCRYTCDDGWLACDGNQTDVNGCEQNITDDPAHCGSCTMACPRPDPGCGVAICSGGSCGATLLPANTVCNADDDPCTDDRCNSTGQCNVGASVCDAGVDAGRDAGPRDSGPRDSGLCSGSTCTSGQSCCGATCCASDSCCGGTLCCPSGQTCDTASGTPTCVSTPRDGGGEAGTCGGFACGMPSDACCGGATCCDTTVGGFCCGMQCCSPGQMCDVSGSCVWPDAGSAECRSCVGPGRYCCSTTFGGVCCASTDTCDFSSGCIPAEGGACPGGCGTGVCCPSADGGPGYCCASGMCGPSGTCSV